MTYEELVDAVSAQAGVAKSDARKTIDAMKSVVMKTAMSGEDVKLPGLGRFHLKTQKARKIFGGREIPEKHVLGFKIFRSVKEKAE